MDNAFFYYTDRIEEMCYNAVVKFMYLLLYSPDLNPIEEYFAKLKAFFKRNWQVYEGNRAKVSMSFLNSALIWLGEKTKVLRAISDMQD